VLANLSIGLLWIVVIIQGAIILAFVHQLAALRDLANTGAPTLAKLPVGAPAPEFTALELQSNRAVPSSSFAGRRIVLCFMNADCHVCRRLAFEISQQPADALAGLVIYYEGMSATVGAVFQELAEKIPVLCKDAVDLSVQFGLDKFPVAVVIDETGRIAGTTYPFRAADLLASLAGVATPAPAGASALTPLADQS
jgi:hypothetical protein